MKYLQSVAITPIQGDGFLVVATYSDGTQETVNTPDPVQTTDAVLPILAQREID